MDLLNYLGIVCLSLLAVIGFCNVWFAADYADANLMVRIRPLWLQRICRFFLVVAVVLLPVMDVIFTKVTPPIDGNNIILGRLCLFIVVGALLIFLALVFYGLCNFIAFLLKELAKYVWNE